VEEFAMTCEGLTDWRRHNTWRIHFEQRLDRPATMCGLQVGTRYFTVLFRGYAWIDKETFQIVHMETDLLRPIPELRLDMDHQSVDYRSVALSERDTSLWLPEVAEITVDFKGKRLVERHTFSNYRVFFVETGQRIGKPKDLSD
jgi:hypothetical protein